MSNNPFETIDARLANIEKLLLDIKHPERPPEPSDRIGIKEACLITGLSKAAVYKYTHLKQMPHLKFARRLVFSRRQIESWVEDHTLQPIDSLSETMNQNLRRSAKKHIRNEK